MKALLLVDIQNDFLPGGKLAVHEGDKIIPVANSLLEYPFDLRLATKDWHPIDHGSFAEIHSKQPGEFIMLQGLKQILWPSHCVQNTLGAEFSRDLHQEKIQKVFYKGTDKQIDSYSAFFDNRHAKSTGLADYLYKNKIEELYILGLATDYCVKYSALDALKLGFKVFVVVDGCRGVNLHKEDSLQALKEIENAGGSVIHSHDIALTS